MNRNFYSFAIFFAILYTIIAFFHSIIYFRLGAQTYSLELFPFWYVCAYLISLIGTLTVLKYYHYRKYAFTLWTAIITVAATLFQFIIVYSLLMGVRELTIYYIPAMLLVLSTSILYSVSLIFSDAGKRPWLKTAGVVAFVMGILLVSTIIWSISPPDVQKNVTAEKIHQWTSLIGSLIPLLFMMNFLDEIKLLKKENPNSPEPPMRSLESVMGIAAMVSVVAVLIIGSDIAGETLSKISWEKHLSVKSKEWTKLFEARTFARPGGDTLKYQLLTPLDHDPQKKYPLVVCLPYGGGVEGCPPAQELLNDNNRKKYPAFLFVPYCKDGSGWGGITNYPTVDSLVFESLYALEEEFKEIDVKRIYVTGVSRGGYGSWHFIGTAPKMFAAAIPVCGGGDPSLAAKMTDVSVWAFHGEKDRNVPVKLSRDMIEAIKNAGGNPKYTEFSGAGHNIWDRVNNTPGLLDWLFAQQRD